MGERTEVSNRAGDPAAEEREMSLPEAVEYAAGLHRAGQLDAAERIYREVLKVHPQYADCLHFLGVLRHQRGDSAAAEALIRQAIELAPDAAGQWNNLGNVLLEAGRADEAVEIYRHCLELAPEFADTHNNLGAVLRARNDPGGAEAAYRRALELRPDFADAWNNLAALYLGQKRISDAVEAACRAIVCKPRHGRARKVLGYAYYRLGELERAAQVYRDWLAEEPGNPMALHHLAACEGAAAPERASDAYVESTFDEFAASFDQKLEMLEYRAPRLVAEALERVLAGAAGAGHVLDAGCGTGLCGPLLRPLAERLSGVDLSLQMLAKADARGCYDTLHKAELSLYLETQPASFDVIVSADTLCYFGDLQRVVRAASGALRGAGPLLFTVEVLDDAGADAGYRLEPHGRYVHAADYLRDVLGGAGFVVSELERVILRYESGDPVAGWLVCGFKTPDAPPDTPATER
jgi:predicted TPR repeat methyltransferase